MVPESKAFLRINCKTSVPAKNDMVKGSSNLKINNKIEITTLAMMKFFDCYCFVMLKKYSRPIEGIVKEP
jgi:hypothetical protein